MSRQLALFVALTLFSGVVAVREADAQTFDLIGHPDPNAEGFTYALSGDGRTAVGGVSVTGEGYTWTRAAGRHVFGALPGMPNTSTAYAVSNAGDVVAGAAEQVAYRYRIGDASIQTLGVQPSYATSQSMGISGDGEVVVGRSIAGLTEEFGQAFRWTSTTGMVGLGYTRPEHFYSEAAAISRDGSTIVGHGRGGSGWNEAFVWRAGSGMVALPGLDATNEGRAFGVNHNGSIIVGDSRPGPFQQAATMWVGGQTISLGLAPAFSKSRSLAVNDAGTVVVGDIFNGPGISQTAAIWTPDRGMEPLSNYLAFHGIAVPAGINLATATGVSSDGMTISGYTGFPGQIRDGFVVTIPAPSAVVLPLIALGVLASSRRRK